MFSKVRVSKNALNYFRQLARQTPDKEIQAYIAGFVNNINEIEITDFLYTKKYAIQTSCTVAWFQEDYDKLKERVEKEGKRIIGNIHTHPNYDAVLSEQDFTNCVTEQFVVVGLVSIRNNKTRARFWTPTSALPCKIIYT